LSQEIHEIIFSINLQAIKEAEAQTKRLLEAEKTSSKLSIEQEKQKTVSINLEGKKRLQDNQATNRLLLSDNQAANQKALIEYKNTEAQKIKAAQQTAREISKFQGQSMPLPAPGSLQQLRNVRSGLTGQLTSGLGTSGQLLGAAEIAALEQGLAKVNPQIKQHEAALRSAGQEKKLFSQATLQNLQSLTLFGFGLTMVAGYILRFDEQAFLLAAKNEQLRGNFKGTEDELLNLKAAFANTVDGGKVLQLSNQASLLGIRLDQQAKFADVARLAGQKMGIDTAESFETLLKSTEFVGRAIISLGLSKTKYNEITKGLVASLGGETEMMANENGQKELTIKNLTAEQQQKIRIEALNKLVADSYGDISNAEVTTYEKTQQITVIFDALKEGLGKGLIKTLDDTSGALGKVSESQKDLAKRTEDLKSAMADWAEYISIGPLPLALLELKKLTDDVSTAVGYLFGTIESHTARGNIPTDILNLIPKTKGIIEDPIKKFLAGFVSLPGIPAEEGKTPSGKTGTAKEIKDKEELLSLLEQEKKKKDDLLKQLELNSDSLQAQLEIWQKIIEAQYRINELQGKTIPGLKEAKPKTFDLEQYQLYQRTELQPPTNKIPEKPTVDELISKMVGSMQTVGSGLQSAMNILHMGTNSFVGSLISGYQNIITLMNDVLSIFQAIKTMQQIGDIISSIIPGAASGVENFRGGLLMTGEKGREIVNLPRGSTVYNNMETRMLMDSMRSPAGKNVTNLYVMATMDGLEFMKINSPKYDYYKKFKKL
jgi:hypothetical protein